MKITFPYMGPVIAYKKLFDVLGYEVITPPRPTQRTISLGAKYSPEFACFPFKVLMGSYIEACEMGADTIVSSGGHGPCRAGFYGEIHERVLKKMGYNVDVIIFDEPLRNIKDTLIKLKRIKGHNSLFTLLKGAKLVYDVMHALDMFDKKVHIIKPYEVRNGSVDRAWYKIQNIYSKVFSQKELKKATAKCKEMIDCIELKEVPEQEKIRVGVVGEIYVVMEPSINMEIENLLNRLGCETERGQYLSEWVDFQLVPGGGENERAILQKGEKYIKINIGGHAKQTVGHIVDYKERGYDGIIHLKPFACLPELVSESIIPYISNEHDIPVLTISLDEQTGSANNITRVEAFVDLLKSKKKTKKFSA